MFTILTPPSNLNESLSLGEIEDGRNRLGPTCTKRLRIVSEDFILTNGVGENLLKPVKLLVSTFQFSLSVNYRFLYNCTRRGLWPLFVLNNSPLVYLVNRYSNFSNRAIS